MCVSRSTVIVLNIRFIDDCVKIVSELLFVFLEQKKRAAVCSHVCLHVYIMQFHL